MNPQTFSLEMCRLLSSLAPGFEGHYKYVKISGLGPKKIVGVRCLGTLNSELWRNYKLICPAWQADDVLRNLLTICRTLDQLRKEPIDRDILIKYIVQNIIGYEDDTATAYQKIEEYLWTIFK